MENNRLKCNIFLSYFLYLTIILQSYFTINFTFKVTGTGDTGAIMKSFSFEFGLLPFLFTILRL